MTAILVTHPAHFLRAPNGHVYAPDQVLDYRFFSRYLAVFERVGVAARVAQCRFVPEDAPQADGLGVEFCDLPDYVGPWQYLRQALAIKACLREAIGRYDSFCLRVPCANATRLWRELRREGRPFGLELVGDPADSLGRGAYRSVLRPAARWNAMRALRRQCRTADLVAYVTRESLQRRYPPAATAFATHYSSLDLPPEALIDTVRSDFRGSRRLIFVGTLAVLYKAPDVLIRAVARIGRPDVLLTLVGDGRQRPELTRLAGQLGIAEQVEFRGTLPAGAAVRAALDDADLFVLPSRQEGLPRAMIEAMARGLPCIGSRVGGIPELLPSGHTVPPGDVPALAGKIAEFLDNPQLMQDAARRNLRVAGEYLAPIVAERRTEFYRRLQQVSGGARGHRP
jgi:glycosyltransferase involved in cell wall biosynthesis